MVQHSHPYMMTGKTRALTIWTIVGKVMSLLFITLCRFLIAFLPRSKHLLILSLQSQSTVILEPPNKICHCSHLFLVYLPWSDGTICHDLSFFKCWVLSKVFHSPLSPVSRGSLVSSLLSAIKVVSPAHLRRMIFLLAVLIPACESPILAFHLMYSAYELNKQGNKIQPCHNFEPVCCSMCGFNCGFLTCVQVFWRQVR